LYLNKDNGSIQSSGEDQTKTTTNKRGNLLLEGEVNDLHVKENKQHMLHLTSLTKNRDSYFTKRKR